MGVSGSGKTTIGKLLAQRHDGDFFDADDYHPTSNIQKMAAGHPLTDDDRLPWLKALRENVIDPAPQGKLTVLACSALKEFYREILGLNLPDVSTVFLKGEPALLAKRIGGREGHYMKPEMLASQLQSLEAPNPEEAFYVSIVPGPEEIVAEIEAALFGNKD